MSRISRFLSFLGRIYFQYIIILLIAVFFAYILNTIFAIDDANMRIMFSSFFLVSFAGAIILFWKI